MMYPKLSRQELAQALDEKGRNKAVAANFLTLIAAVGGLVYFVVTRSMNAVAMLITLVLIVVALIVGSKIQESAVIESVYRTKEGRNKKLYRKHKHYFDSKKYFLKMNAK